MPNLTPGDYHPAGSTALYDGLGAMIETIGARVDQGPGNNRVLIVTITDGDENVSQRYNAASLREVIQYRQKVCGWRFVLIAPKPAGVAFNLGIPVTNTLRWEAEPAAISAIARAGQPLYQCLSAGRP